MPHGQNGGNFADDIFIYIYLNENFYILIKISPNFVPKDPIDNAQYLFRYWLGAE